MRHVVIVERTVLETVEIIIDNETVDGSITLGIELAGDDVGEVLHREIADNKIINVVEVPKE